MKRAVAICMLGLLAISGFSSAAPALAQTSEEEGQSGDQQRTLYSYSHPKATADLEHPFIVYTENRLHKPGDEVRIQGYVWSGLLAETDNPDSVLVLVRDSKNTILVRAATPINSDGGFSISFSLPGDSEPGIYYIYPQIRGVELGTLSADTVAKLETSSTFLVASIDVFVVEAEEKEFEVAIASTSSVSDFEFDQEAKKISFTVEGADGTEGVTQITIPKPLLSGRMTVMIDDEIVPPEADSVVVTSDTDPEMTLELNYSHSVHAVEITGTNVVPEFTVSMVVMAATIGLVVAALSVANQSNLLSRRMRT